MAGWQGLLVGTVVAVIVATPWLRVAIARDQAAMLRELRGAAIITVLVICFAWIAWIYERSAFVATEMPVLVE